MISSINIGGNGIFVEDQWLNAISQNIANANTPGYGRRQTEIASLPNVAARPVNTALGGQVLAPGLTLGNGARLAAN